MNNAGIPCIVHHSCEPRRQQWMPIWHPCYHSWRQHLPWHRHWCWSNHRIRVFVREIFPQYWEFFRNLPLDIMRYDISRCLMLYHYGGIYADMDTFVYRDFTSELDQHIHVVAHPDGVLASNGELEFVSNWLMCARPRQQFFLDCVELARWRCGEHLRHLGQRFLQQDLIHQVLYLTGPFVVGAVFRAHDLAVENMLAASHYTSLHYHYHDRMCVKHIGAQSWTGWIPGTHSCREGYEYLTANFDFYLDQPLNYDS